MQKLSKQTAARLVLKILIECHTRQSMYEVHVIIHFALEFGFASTHEIRKMRRT